MPATPTSVLPNTCTALMFAEFAELAVEGAIWLNMEALRVACDDPKLGIDNISLILIEDRTMTIRDLNDLADEQRNDMFIAGFRNMPHTASQFHFELLLSLHPNILREAFQERWKVVEKPVISVEPL
jgi:hypothetical protein